MKRLANFYLAFSFFISAPALAKAPWFENRDCTNKDKIHAYSVTDQYRYDASGNIIQSLWDTGRLSCVLELNICGDRIFKSKEISRAGNEACPPEFNSQSYSGATVCCDEWKRAKQSNSPCNPLTDADCDGIANSEDSTPTEAGPGTEPPPPPKKGGKTLHADLRVIIQAPQQFPLGVMPFTLKVHNLGPGNASAVRLTGSLSSGKFVYATTSQGDCQVSQNSVSCEFGTVPSDHGGSVSVQARTEAEGDLVITADVTGAEPDNITANNHAEATVKVKKAVKGTLSIP